MTQKIRNTNTDAENKRFQEAVLRCQNSMIAMAEADLLYIEALKNGFESKASSTL